MIVSVPDWTCGTLPDTGASSIVAPCSLTRSAIARLARGLTVLRSTQIFPGARPARMPSGWEATSSMHLDRPGSEVRITSAASADAPRALTPLESFVDQRLGAGATLRLAVDGVARGEQARGHVPTHVPEPDEAELYIS